MENNDLIKHIPFPERPREKLMRDGVTSLSNEELIAILLGSGSKSVPIMRICKELISAVHNDAGNLSRLGIEELCQIKGIGEFKAMILIAAFELGVRSSRSNPLILREDKAVKEFIRPYLDGQIKQYYLVMMNNRQELLAISELVTIENHPPQLNPVIKLCLEAGASELIICRNEVALNEKHLNKENGFVILLDAAASMLKLKFRGLLVID